MLKSLIILAIVAAPIAYAANDADANEVRIDEGLYSRQLYVLGHEAMRRMANSSVLISGLGGLGVEIAKNVILSGVKSVTLHDTVAATLRDLSSQFYLTEADIGKNRAEASLQQLSELNNYVRVHVHTGELTEEFLQGFQSVVLTETSNAEQDRIAAITHENNIPLIIGDTRGLFGRVFCDFGVDFTVFDPNDTPIKQSLVEHISNEEKGVVTCLDDKRHDLEDGDLVIFTEVEGMDEINEIEPVPVRVLTPFKFTIGDTRNFSRFAKGGVVTQVKLPRNLTFNSLAESRKNPTYQISDIMKFDRLDSYHVAFDALDEFITENGRFPTPWSESDAEAFLNLSTVRNTELSYDEKLLKTFAKISAGDVCPMNSIIGGVIAQEVLKSCSGKFTPIQQYMYLDSLEALPEEDLTEEECAPIDSRYDRQIAVFGRTFQEKLGNLRYFIVGAGAIGCEYLKNFAMTGIAAGPKGEVIVTDMDLIEKSNLNRQFLFRPHDVQHSKSETAAKVVKGMNKDINITPQLNRVGPETENIYSERFFEKLDGVANALDNNQARLYMDQRCLTSRKSLIDGGTEGTKGNIQIIVPFLTKTYGQSNDGAEESYAACTLKSFPYLIQHTLQWARDMFEGVFSVQTKNAEIFMRDPSFLDALMKLGGSQAMMILESLEIALIKERPQDFAACVEWARLHFEDNYSNQILQLLHKLPADSYASDNVTLFWSPPKRCPTAVKFDVNNTLHMDYIVAAANLKAQMYGIQQVRDRDEIAELVLKVEVPEFVPEDGASVALTEEEAEAEERKKKQGAIEPERIPALVEELKKIASQKLNVSALDFEKDDDSNFHMDFIVACSNLRATNYGIEHADRHKSKLTAGKIIPAIATTTTVVSGFAMLEMFKLAQGHTDIDRYLSASVNLAIAFVAGFAPEETPKLKYNDVEFTQWDRFELTGEMTLTQLIDHFRNEHGLEITGLMQGQSILYASWQPPSKTAPKMNMTISQLVESVTRRRIHPTVRSLQLQITCTTLEDEDVDEVPIINYSLPRRHRHRRPAKNNPAPAPAPEQAPAPEAQ